MESNNEKSDEHFKKFNIDYSKDMEKEEEFEILKLRDPNVHVFELPPMSSAKGHLASEFNKLIFKGMMKMTVKGNYMFIYFLNPNNTIFLAPCFLTRYSLQDLRSILSLAPIVIYLPSLLP